jgi:antitoxin component YwqK of YwqJK toxin-antitoxin module
LETCGAGPELAASSLVEGTTEKSSLAPYSENGQLSSEGPALNGIKIGEWKFWHTNGALAAQGEYESGDLEGEWSFWNPDGSLKERGEFHDGARIGPWTRTPPP